MKHLVLAAAGLAAMAGARAETATYNIDPSHTFASFEIVHAGTSTIRARFDKKEGSVQLDKAGKTGRAEITIDMASVNSGVAPFDSHLKSKEFFNVADNPTAKLVADKFVFNGDKLTEVSGTLTLVGQTHPVTLKANNFGCYNSPVFKREVCGGDFETTLMRSQWGINTYLGAVAPDNVRLLVQVEAIKQ